MCIIKFSTQQRNGIYDMTHNLKIITSVRGELTFCGVFSSIAQVPQNALTRHTRAYYVSFMLNPTGDVAGNNSTALCIMYRLRVRAVFHKTVRVCHVYCNFKIGFTCRFTVIFGTLKDGSLLINTLASNICFSDRNMFQNGVDALSKIVDAFLSKSSKFYLGRISR